MQGTVTLYMNTGFNGTDIPASPDVLEMAVHTEFPGVYFERMDVDLTSIDLKVSYELIRDADYLKLAVNKPGGTVQNFYYRCIPTALAKGVTRMSLQLDGLLTLGGAVNCEYISGWQERGHIAKADDTLFGNIVAEGWVPSQPLVTANMNSVRTLPGDGITADLDIMTTAVDLPLLGKNGRLKQDIIEGIVSGTQRPEMYLPAIPAVKPWAQVDPDDPTYLNYQDFGVWDFDENQYHTYAIPGTGIYRLTDPNTYNGISILFSDGQLSLQGSYHVPKEYINSFGVVSERFHDVNGVHNVTPLTFLPFEYSIQGYTPKNKKVYATYRTFSVTNLASGDINIKTPEQLYDGSSSYPSLRIWADLSCAGKPYARFNWIKDNPLQYVDCVKGLQWSNSQIVLEGASGSLWNSIDTAYSNMMNERAQQNLLVQTQFNERLQQNSAEAYDIERNKQKSFELPFKAGEGVMKFLGGAVLTALQFSSKFAGGGTSFGANKSVKTKGAAEAKNRAEGGLMAMSGVEMMTSGIHQAGDAIYDQFVGTQRSLENVNNANVVDREKMEYEQRFANEDINLAINKNGIELLKNNRCVAPTVAFSPEINLGLYGYNYFVVYETRKTLADLKSEDDYYQRYGYSGLHRPLTQQCFKERTHYNFVQAFDINLKGYQGLNYGMRVNSVAIAQLNGGVRVWRELPNAAAYQTN